MIAGVVAAEAAITALEKSVFETNPDFDGADDTDEDGLVTVEEAEAVQQEAEADRALIGNGATTAALTRTSETAASNLLKAKALVEASSATVKANVATYDAAVAAQKALVGDTEATAAVGVEGDANYVPAQTAAQAAEAKAAAAATTALTAADTSLKAAGAVTTYEKLSTAFGETITTQAQLETALEGSAPGKSALITELQKLPTYGQAAIDTVAAHKAIEDANVAVTTAAGADFGNTNYVSASVAAATAADTLAKALVADAAVKVATDVVAQFTAADDQVTLANTALNTFKTANAEKVTIHTDLADHGTAPRADDVLSAKSDVFYFSSVNDSTTANDFTLGGSTAATKFGAGDHIVLGSDYTFNSGALSTGDNNKLEFFLVQKGNDTLVVIETENYGSASVTHTATGDAALTPADSANAAIITLTGVAAADLTVNNGVISHVA